MYLYPYKIFTVSNQKRLYKIDDLTRPVGIYEATKMKYIEARDFAYSKDMQVSVLLGDVGSGVKLICLDLDDCFTPEGKLENDTKEFLKEFKDTEYEVSSSGEGIHVYILTKLDLSTFIVKNLEGCKSFECYTNKRHIVTTTFDFENNNLQVGIHDKFITDLYERVEKQKTQKNTVVEDAKMIFSGKVIKDDADIRGAVYKRTPVRDFYTLRGLCLKDPVLKEVIDMCPDSVDQSAHDAKLIRKLAYYTLDIEAAWEMAKKTNYYKDKDARHKKKFDDPTYRARTNRLLCR